MFLLKNSALWGMRYCSMRPCTVLWITSRIYYRSYHITSLILIHSERKNFFSSSIVKTNSGCRLQEDWYRLPLLLIQSQIRQITLLLITHCEKIEIYYAQEDARSPKMILCLHNLCWRHAIKCTCWHHERLWQTGNSLVCTSPPCVTHSSQLLRVASHRPTNAEMFQDCLRSCQV